MRVRGLETLVQTMAEREDRLLQAARAVTAASRDSTDSVLSTLAGAVRVLEPSVDSILVFVPAGESLRCIYAGGARAEHFSGALVRRDDPISLPAAAARRLHRIELRGKGAVIPSDRSAIAVPMSAGAGACAVVYAGSRDDELPNAELVVRAVEHAAAPYLLALDRESDRANATFDALTGLHGPRSFRARLAEDIETAMMSGKSCIALWFIDTDHFKQVNDTLGHAAGDAVLRDMAALLKMHTLEGVDTSARNGGDEFCAILRDVQKTVAIERAQQLCQAVRAHDFGVDVALTASIGVAAFPFDAGSANELLEVADAAMYHSKRSGRDCVSFAARGGFAVYR